ncbi:uncharacterized protein LOC110057466 isoform X2 [Orbicella faveolata]|uniref:uncharacterized protein LOC110057466 isoform X2 n=1 Tax=Orbicella faveolata TaxID=48498 RepID=UPI0009E44B83|nr:uncharacterized protein LOC110057466 isoform X2 [Orbicella faveolata]
MNEAHANQYLELDSVKTEIEPTIYDDVVAESSTPAGEQTSYETCSREGVKKRQASADLENAYQRDMVVLRRMLFCLSAVVVVALLTAAAALFVAISAMKDIESRQTATDGCPEELHGRAKQLHNLLSNEASRLTNKL